MLLLLLTYIAPDFVCIEDFVRALGAKSSYFSPSSLVVNNITACQDNPPTW